MKSIKSLQNKANELWKEYCYKRDGRECMVRKYFPSIQVAHSDTYQVDHCFSRNNKILFFDVSNGTVVCSSCNSCKSNHMKSIELAIFDIVRTREGNDKFNSMRAINEGITVNINWKKRWWLEEQIKNLEDLCSKSQ